MKAYMRRRLEQLGHIPKSSYIYEFWWWNDTVLIEIEADKDEVEKLLETYRKGDPHHTIDSWLDFLAARGGKAKLIEPDYRIYF